MVQEKVERENTLSKPVQNKSDTPKAVDSFLLDPRQQLTLEEHRQKHEKVTPDWRNNNVLKSIKARSQTQSQLQTGQSLNTQQSEATPEETKVDNQNYSSVVKSETLEKSNEKHELDIKTQNTFTHLVQPGGAVQMNQETLRPKKFVQQQVSAKSNKEGSLFTKPNNLDSAQLEALPPKHFQQSYSQDIRNKQAIGHQAKTARDNKGNSKLSVSSMSYQDKLVAAAKMVPELLAGDAKAAFKKLISDPGFISQLVAVGVAFAALQAIPFVGQIIDAALVVCLGFSVAWSLVAFLAKTWIASDEESLRSAAVELKNLVETVGIAAITGILLTAAGALKGIKLNRRIPRISTLLKKSPVSLLKEEFSESYLATLSKPMRERYDLLIQGVKNGTFDLTKPSVYRRFLILKRVKELRTGLTKAVSSEANGKLLLGRRNIAYGSYKITLPNGKIINGDFISVSGKKISKIITEQVGTSFNKKTVIPEVTQVKNQLGRFEVRRDGGEAGGDHDSERKVFEYILNQMEKSLGTPLKVNADYQGRGFSGKIVVNSEMTPCTSCENIMGPQFQKMFGKDIQIDVHSGVDYP